MVRPIRLHVSLNLFNVQAGRSAGDRIHRLEKVVGAAQHGRLAAHAQAKQIGNHQVRIRQQVIERKGERDLAALPGESGLRLELRAEHSVDRQHLARHRHGQAQALGAVIAGGESHVHSDERRQRHKLREHVAHKVERGLLGLGGRVRLEREVDRPHRVAGGHTVRGENLGDRLGANNAILGRNLHRRVVGHGTKVNVGRELNGRRGQRGLVVLLLHARGERRRALRVQLGHQLEAQQLLVHVALFRGAHALRVVEPRGKLVERNVAVRARVDRRERRGRLGVVEHLAEVGEQRLKLDAVDQTRRVRVVRGKQGAHLIGEMKFGCVGSRGSGKMKSGLKSGFG